MYLQNNSTNYKASGIFLFSNVVSRTENGKKTKQKKQT